MIQLGDQSEHSDHSAEGITQIIRIIQLGDHSEHSDHSAEGITQIIRIIQLGDHSEHSSYQTLVLKPSALTAKAFGPQN